MGWNLNILIAHEVASYSCKKLLLINLRSWTSWLPVFKLPFVATTKNSNYSFPLRVAKTLRVVIDIKSDFTLVYDPLYLDRLCNIS